jgi:hypothetical protein
MLPAQADNPAVPAPVLRLDYFKPAPWLPMPVQYPVGLALIAAVVALAALIMGRRNQLSG